MFGVYMLIFDLDFILDVCCYIWWLFDLCLCSVLVLGVVLIRRFRFDCFGL